MNLGKCLIFLAIFLVIPLSTLAGDEICNGGDVVVCSNQRIRLLDIIERNALYGLTNHPNEVEMTLTRSYKLQFAVGKILSPIKKLSPNIYKCLNTYLKDEDFFSEIRFVKAADFGDVNDESAYVIPRGCQKVQAAMQFRTIKPFSGYRYFINEDLWKKMDDFQRTALLLHEVILRNYILSPQWSGDTTSVRYLTGLIASAEISTMSAKQFNAVLESISFTCTEHK